MCVLLSHYIVLALAVRCLTQILNTLVLGNGLSENRKSAR